MRSFAASQLLIYLFLLAPEAWSYRAFLLGLWLLCALRQPLSFTLGAAWELAFLHAHLPFNLRSLLARPSFICDDRFWMICSPQNGTFLQELLNERVVGKIASTINAWAAERCLAWDPLWGRLALSLALGAQPDSSLQSLYRNLGFLHVLVISGSQFTILAAALLRVLRMPLRLFYALTAIDWRDYRLLSVFVDLIAILVLLVYLLACGATAPCQRAFIQQVLRVAEPWQKKPRFLRTKPRTNPSLRLFSLQLFLFPETAFSLSNFLSWAAVRALGLFQQGGGLLAQFKTSLAIQVTSLLLLGRVSLSALLWDFFLAPFWDLLLFVCLLGGLGPEAAYKSLLIRGLELFHSALWQVDIWQTAAFGSSSWVLRPSWQTAGRALAALLALWLFRPRRAAFRLLAR